MVDVETLRRRGFTVKVRCCAAMQDKPCERNDLQWNLIAAPVEKVAPVTFWQRLIPRCSNEFALST
jgi:hypothetical protein